VRIVAILTDVDGEIQHIYEQDSEEHDACADTGGLWVSTKDAQEATDDFLRPR
jgi:hypothetical protein